MQNRTTCPKRRVSCSKYNYLVAGGGGDVQMLTQTYTLTQTSTIAHGLRTAFGSANARVPHTISDAQA